MPKFRKLPDGSVVEFQDHLSDGEIEVAMRTILTGGPAGKPEFAGRPPRYEPKTEGPVYRNQIKRDIQKRFGSTPEPEGTLPRITGYDPDDRGRG